MRTQYSAFTHLNTGVSGNCSYIEHETNANVRNMLATLVGPHKPLLANNIRQKQAWLGHVTRQYSL
ncbi:hypothetical protein DPMN_000286 [Dreissena polymorpha]|uniref:Uncharacterized protein n=1 Tax=Dreissena polymorpha TaxID=45954 RepID=A0A9D4MIP5_DREPO|nr:hypothetical protein DPMN_000286 [Dreissena polymorpha]